MTLNNCEILKMETKMENSIKLSKLVINNASSSSNSDFSQKPGPLLDDGAPYSAIGIMELEILMDSMDQKIPNEL